jgi:hypothetical protein
VGPAPSFLLALESLGEDLKGIENLGNVDSFGFDFSSNGARTPLDFDQALAQIDRIPPNIPVELRIPSTLMGDASKLRTKSRSSLWIIMRSKPTSLPAIPQGFKFVGLEF